MSSIIDDFKRPERFWDDLSPPWQAPRYSGSATHHCDICPMPDWEKCQEPCFKEREKLKDGVKVSVG